MPVSKLICVSENTTCTIIALGIAHRAGGDQCFLQFEFSGDVLYGAPQARGESQRKETRWRASFVGLATHNAKQLSLYPSITAQGDPHRPPPPPYATSRPSHHVVVRTPTLVVPPQNVDRQQQQVIIPIYYCVC